jgi:hypothetical protein
VTMSFPFSIIEQFRPGSVRYEHRLHFAGRCVMDRLQTVRIGW